MRVGQVAGYINLMRFHFAEQVEHDFYVGLADRVLFNLSGFIEREVKEVTAAERNMIERTSGTSFSTTNQTFDGQDVACIHVAFFLGREELFDFSIFVADNFVFTIFEQLVKTVDEMHETYHFFIAYSNVSGSFVSHMYFMSLLNEAAQCTSHGDYIVIRMRREYHHAFREWFGTFRTIGIIGIRFATRPSGNGVLQVVEYLDIGIVGRAVKSQQFAQTVFIIVLVGQFQDRLVQCSTQPYNGTSYQFVVPFTAGYQPWTLDTGQVSCCSQVYAYRSVGVKLQVRCR